MAQPRRGGLTGFKIHFTDQTDVENGEIRPSPTYEMPDITNSFELVHNNQSIKIKKASLIDIRVLGRGHYADTVMLCEVQEHPEIKMAVKSLGLCPRRHNINDFTTQTDLKTIRTIGCSDNNHITKFYGAFKDQEHAQLVICMEPCDTSVDRFSQKLHELKQTEALDILLKRMILHISDALSFLKSRKILHRDVKPSNILINKNPVVFKLCDFGISAEMIDSAAKTMMKGTQIYMAPERINHELAPSGYGIQSDMWSLGLSAFQIAANKHPFENLEVIEMMGKIKTWKPEPPEILSTELRKLICWMLEFNHGDRPSTYPIIKSTVAIKSLPEEITELERRVVSEVIDAVMNEPFD